MNQFSQRSNSKFRNNAPHIGMYLKCLNLFNDLSGKALTDLRHKLLCIPRLHFLNIAKS